MKRPSNVNQNPIDRLLATADELLQQYAILEQAGFVPSALRFDLALTDFDREFLHLCGIEAV